MAETILQARILPEPILRFIHTDKVRIRESKGVVHVIPVEEPSKPTSHCPFLGLYTDGKLTVEGFLAQRREDMELEL